MLLKSNTALCHWDTKDKKIHDACIVYTLQYAKGTSWAEAMSNIEKSGL